jgi:hypothetical protein
MKDEGIVQAISKELEQLSRRLHQKCRFPGEIRGACFSPSTYDAFVVQARRTKLLTAEAAAYIAGLIDGEGTITLSRLHANESRRIAVSIANTEHRLLQFVIDQVGLGKITRKKAASDRHTPSFCYAIAGRQALELLRQIAPYLQSYKRLRADLALHQYVQLTPRNGKYTPNQLADRREFETKFLAIKAHCRSNVPRQRLAPS